MKFYIYISVDQLHQQIPIHQNCCSEKSRRFDNDFNLGNLYFARDQDFLRLVDIPPIGGHADRLNGHLQNGHLPRFVYSSPGCNLVINLIFYKFLC